VRGSDFLPINLVIDGRLDLPQERDRVLMKDHDKQQLAEALHLIPALAELAIDENWAEGHKLARVGMPERSFGEDLAEHADLREWWRSTLGAVATAIADIPIVQTPAGLLKASGDGRVAAFVVPRFDLQIDRDELSTRVHEFAPGFSREQRASAVCGISRGASGRYRSTGSVERVGCGRRGSPRCVGGRGRCSQSR
jgi:hypothetical protein